MTFSWGSHEADIALRLISKAHPFYISQPGDRPFPEKFDAEIPQKILVSKRLGCAKSSLADQRAVDHGERARCPGDPQEPFNVAGRKFNGA